MLFRFCRSLLALSPLYRLIGNLPLESSHAKFLLTHKYILGSPVAKPHALIGYFNCSEKLKPLLCEILQISLPLWCDGSVLRHMSLQHHYRFSGIITLATTCYDCEMSNKKVNTGKPVFLQILGVCVQWNLTIPAQTPETKNLLDQ